MFSLYETLTISSFQVNSFTLRQSPPTVEFFQERQNEIKEWGAQVTEDEIYNLEELGQFIGTDFTRLSERQLIMNSSADRSKRSTPAALPVEFSHKTRLLDFGSLYRIIPQVWNVYALCLFRAHQFLESHISTRLHLPLHNVYSKEKFTIRQNLSTSLRIQAFPFPTTSGSLG